MNIREIIKILTDAGIEQNEAEKEFEIMAEHFFSYTATDKAKGKILSDEQLEYLKDKCLLRASNRIPVQYITGYSWFMGEKFKVNENVLIPRDETEILVLAAIEKINEYDLHSVLDVGTGSGCIACTIAKRTNSVVLGIDISSDALRVALDNVTQLGINNRAVFRKSDIFSKIRNDEKFDLIVSNPPYISRNTVLQAEVQHEPDIALFADDNGLLYYRKIIAEAHHYLNNGGFLMFELGEGEAKYVHDMMKTYYTDITIIRDLAGINRVITARMMP